MSVGSIWSNVLFKVYVSSLTFCLDDLSIDESGMLKFLMIVVLLSISPLMIVNICLILEVVPCGVHVYLLLGLDPFINIVPFFVSYNHLCFVVLFCLLTVLQLQLVFDFHFSGILSPIPLLAVCKCP